MEYNFSILWERMPFSSSSKYEGYFLFFFVSKAVFAEDSKYLEESRKEDPAKINESLKKLRLDIFPIPIPLMPSVLYITQGKKVSTNAQKGSKRSYNTYLYKNLD